jgi:hypothetical protein
LERPWRSCHHLFFNKILSNEEKTSKVSIMTR